eukprot:CAMPEP_0171132272 /NCGR_PEP_ID=MMETSP0766_2-20121228/124258_1 /TAXON_ID=439317 /ORGANISM="Gambierdiscus australes, Strain CAWD 149" /LENGTH=111 /DNA_ID=CAMNT_0011595603 /DNA_START=23 /DNA_END=358 /DNA_ORIENTATION=+
MPVLSSFGAPSVASETGDVGSGGCNQRPIAPLLFCHKMLDDVHRVVLSNCCSQQEHLVRLRCQDCPLPRQKQVLQEAPVSPSWHLSNGVFHSPAVLELRSDVGLREVNLQR